MKDKMPEIHEAIVAADQLEPGTLFGGHGSALAQVYNHMIMPLANRRDKYTQVCWGIRDFESRFGRKPEGMWLAETAADSRRSRCWPSRASASPSFRPIQASAVREDWQTRLARRQRRANRSHAALPA